MGLEGAEKDEVVVTGYGVDAISLAATMRRKFVHTEVVSIEVKKGNRPSIWPDVDDIEENDEEEDDEEEDDEEDDKEEDDEEDDKEKDDEEEHAEEEDDEEEHAKEEDL